MKIKFTDKYNNRNSNTTPKNIDIQTNCVITNYNPNERKHSQSGDLTAALSGNNFSVKTGTNTSSNKTVDFNKTKFSIFTAICAADGDGSNLTELDLKQAKANFGTKNNALKTLGVVEFRYDEHAGIASLKMNNDEYLRIDLETKAEQAEQSSKKPEVQANKKPEQPKKDEKPSKPLVIKTPKYLKRPEPYPLPDAMKFLEVPVFTPKANNKTTTKCKDTRYSVPTTPIDKATGEGYKTRANNPAQFNNLPESYAPYIKRIARNTGLSEYFIRHLLSTETFIGTAKNIGDGVITVGFGHTNTAEHNTNFKRGDTVSLETAFKWFEQDIIDQAAYARKYFTPTSGEFNGRFKFDDFPQSFKEALIDIAFNRGNKAMASETIYNSLRANFRDGADNMPAAAVRTRQETFRKPSHEAGLRKRNVYRFLLAIRSLSGEYRLAAMRRFDRDEYDNKGNFVKSYYTKTLEMLSINDRKQVEKDWEAARKAAEYDAQQGR